MTSHLTANPARAHIRRALSVLVILLELCGIHPFVDNLSAAPIVESIVVASQFIGGLDGWTGINRDTLGPETIISACDGVDCFARISESKGDSATMYLVAPGRFLGNRGALFGGYLHFRIRQFNSDQFYRTGDVILRSGATQLVYQMPTLPGKLWSVYDVPFEANAWHHADTGSPVSDPELFQVLSSLDRLWIRGEYSNRQTERTDLAEVSMISRVATTPPRLTWSRLGSGEWDVTWPATAGSIGWVPMVATSVSGPWNLLGAGQVVLGADHAWHVRSSGVERSRFVRLMLQQQ